MPNTVVFFFLNIPHESLKAPPLGRLSPLAILFSLAMELQFGPIAKESRLSVAGSFVECFHP